MASIWSGAASTGTAGGESRLMIVSAVSRWSRSRECFRRDSLTQSIPSSSWRKSRGLPGGILALAVTGTPSACRRRRVCYTIFGIAVMDGILLSFKYPHAMGGRVRLLRG